MLILLDSNIFISALLHPEGIPGRIVDAWASRQFKLLTNYEQIEEIRIASQNPKLKKRIARHTFGRLVNNLYGANLWTKPIPRKHQAADPTDSFLLDLIDIAQPDYAITGDRRSGLLELGKLGRTRIVTAAGFCSEALGH